MITEGLDEVIKTPGVCPGGPHKTNEAEFFQPGYALVVHVLVNGTEQGQTPASAAPAR